MYWILFIGIALISYIVQQNLNSKFKKFSKVPLSSGMTGREVAEKMLQDHGIYNVTVTSTPGHLTDHYNPTNNTVNLSPEVYNGNSVAAAAVAAHECGHAVQHAVAYAPLQLRSALVPVVSLLQIGYNGYSWLALSWYRQCLLSYSSALYCLPWLRYLASLRCPLRLMPHAVPPHGCNVLELLLITTTLWPFRHCVLQPTPTW